MRRLFDMAVLAAAAVAAAGGDKIDHTHARPRGSTPPSLWLSSNDRALYNFGARRPAGSKLWRKAEAGKLGLRW